MKCWLFKGCDRRGHTLDCAPAHIPIPTHLPLPLSPDAASLLCLGYRILKGKGKGQIRGARTWRAHYILARLPRKLFFTRLTVPVLCLTLYCDFSKLPTCWAPSPFLFSSRFLAAVSSFALSTSFEQNENPEHKWATLKNTRLKKTKRQVTIA